MLKKIFRTLLSIIFIGSGILHFILPQSYANVMPEWIPFHSSLVFISGFLELVAGIGLFTIEYRKYGSMLIIALLISFIPVHVAHILQDGKVMDDVFLPKIVVWGRLAFQMVFIVWAKWVGK